MAVIMPSPSPVGPSTGDVAGTVPGYDPLPAIDAAEQSLRDYLNEPVRDILARLGLPPMPAPPPPGELPPDVAPAEAGAGTATPMDPSALIQPVTDALGTLGSGLFEGADPTQMFSSIAQALQSTGGSLSQSLVPLQQDWQGVSGSAAASKSKTAIANGTEVGRQSDELRRSLMIATAEVARARARLIAIIAEFQAKLAAIGPSIIFPWGWAAAIEAANEASAQSAQVMTELQGSLGSEAANVKKAGSPVPITAAEQGRSGGAGGFAPLMSAATQALSAGTSAASKAAQAGLQAGSGMASAAGPATAAAATKAGAVKPAGAGGGAGGGSGGGGGGGGGPAAAPRPAAASPMIQPESTGSSAQSMAARSAAAGAGVAGSPMMGGAPMAGHGARAGSDGNYSSPSFLHTTDQGDEIVGNAGSAVPPVLGESDPHESPDVKLRI
jgi:uncharacterized protein YukE